ncbi:MAG: hypothetical protein V1779_13125 [bacterium]
MKKTLILIFLINYITSANNWRLVEEFDNTPTWKYSHVQSIQCFDSNNCYAIVQHATKEDYGCRIYTSSNNGISWESLLSNENEYPQMLNVKAGVAPNSNYYFILSDDNTFLEKSTDGGKTFKIITLEQNNNYPDNIAMYDTNTGLVINSEAIYTTNNGWETFERHPKLHTNQSYYSPIFLDSNTVGMIYGSPWANSFGKGESFVKYYLREDRWDTVFYFQKDPGAWVDIIESIFFVNDTVAYGAGWRSDKSLSSGQYFDIFYKTIDGGNNWNLIFKAFNKPYKGFFDIFFADENNGVAVGYWGKLAMTNDGGETWVYEPLPNDMDNCRKMLVCWAGHTPLIGTWDAGIFRYEGDFFKFPPDTTGVEEKSQNSKINILQTEEKLLISIEDALHRKYKLQICDIMGNVALEQELSSGVGTLYVPYDISGLGSGAYLYMISCEGVVVKTGKLISITN